MPWRKSLQNDFTADQQPCRPVWSHWRSLTIAAISCIATATVVQGLGNLLLPSEGDPRLGLAIAATAWLIGLWGGVWQFRLGSRDASNWAHVRRSIGTQSLLILIVLLGLIGIGVHRAHLREELLRDFHARGGSSSFEEASGGIYGTGKVMRLTVPSGEFNKAELARLRATFPEAVIDVRE